MSMLHPAGSMSKKLAAWGLDCEGAHSMLDRNRKRALQLAVAVALRSGHAGLLEAAIVIYCRDIFRKFDETPPRGIDGPDRCDGP